MSIHHRMTLALGAALVAGTAWTGAASAAYSTSFEQPEYMPGGLIMGQDGWNAPSSPRVQTAAQLAAELEAAELNAAQTVHSGNQALLFTSTGGSMTSIRPVAGLESDTVVSLDFWARPLTPGADGSTIGQNMSNTFIVMEDDEGTRAAAFKFAIVEDELGNLTNDFQVNSASFGGWGSVPNISWIPDTWYNIHLVADYSTKTFDFYVDDVLMNTLAPLDFYNLASANFSQIRVYTGGGQAGMILDDLAVAPEPSAAMLLLAGGGLLAARRRQKPAHA